MFDVAAATALLAVKPVAPAGNADRSWGVFGLAGIAVLAVGFGIHTYENVTSVSRGLVVSKTYHQFDVSRQSEQLTHVFTIENRCRFAVEIAESKATCTCTTMPDLSGCVVSPGETLELPITLNTGEAEEHIIGGVNLFCRKAGSTAAPSFFTRLQVSALVDPDYWVKPVVLNFGKVQGSRLVTQEVRVRPRRMPSMQILEIKSTHPAFRGGAVRRQRETGDYVVEITFDGRGQTRSEIIAAPITIKTSSPNRPHVRLLAHTVFESLLEIEPQAIVVSSDTKGVIVKDIILRGGSPLGVSEVRDGSCVKVTAEPADAERRRWKLRVQIPEIGSADLSDQVRFTVTGLGEMRDLTVPVHRFSHRPKEVGP